jgi:type II secretory pathway pseudopilin PulG
MSTLAVVLIVLGILIVLLAIGGYLAVTRRQRELDPELRRRLEEADNALAAARAQDRGWERSLMEAAARDAAGGPVDELQLIQVQDRPGTDQDLAVFRIISGGDEREVVLGRRDGAWVPADQGA